MDCIASALSVTACIGLGAWEGILLLQDTLSERLQHGIDEELRGCV